MNGLHDLVRKIFGDEKTRSQFEANPDGFLSQFSLTEQEKKAVLNLHAKLGVVGGDSAQLEATLNATSEWLAPMP